LKLRGLRRSINTRGRAQSICPARHGDGLVTDQREQPNEDPIRQCLAAGDYRGGFERLLKLYSTKVFHLAYSMVRNETQAEDMTQDIFLKIWKGLRGYHGGASLSTWIYTIARNTCLTELKRRACRPTVSLYDAEFEDALDRLPVLQSCEKLRLQAQLRAKWTAERKNFFRAQLPAFLEPGLQHGRHRRCLSAVPPDHQLAEWAPGVYQGFAKRFGLARCHGRRSPLPAGRIRSRLEKPPRRLARGLGDVIG